MTAGDELTPNKTPGAPINPGWRASRHPAKPSSQPSAHVSPTRKHRSLFTSAISPEAFATVKTLTKTSKLALRLMRLRNQTRQFSESLRQTFASAEPLLRLPFSASPLAGALTALGVPMAEREAGEADDGSYTPPVAARARIVVNPTSGSVRGAFGLAELRETAKWLTRHGLPTELSLTRYSGHATELAREAAEAGREMVIAAGGDGTLNDVIQALAGHTTALGVLPMGTVNVWAREMGISLHPAEAREVLLHGVRRRVDLGRAGRRYFLMMAGVGFDAEVARRVEQGALKRIGLKLLEYLATAGFLSLTHRSSTLRIRLHGKRRATQALMVIIGNTRLYGGALTFTRRAVADDGMLDVVVISGGNIFHRANVFLRALFRRRTQTQSVRYERAQSVRIEADGNVPVQVDGEVIGALPMTFSVVPQALTVIVPPQSAEDLFHLPPLNR